MYMEKKLTKLIICIVLIFILFALPILSVLASPVKEPYSVQIPISALKERFPEEPGTLFEDSLLKDFALLTEHPQLTEIILSWTEDSPLYETVSFAGEQGTIWIVYNQQNDEWRLIGVYEESTDSELSFLDEKGKLLPFHQLKTVNSALFETTSNQVQETLTLPGNTIFVATLQNLEEFDVVPADSPTTVPTVSQDQTPQTAPDNNYQASKEEGSETLPLVELRNEKNEEPGTASLYGYKKAEQMANTDDIFQIVLDISGQPKTTTTKENMPIDIVLALDLSGSMGSGLFSRWYYLELASKTIIDTFLASPDTANLDINVGIVGYSSFSDVANGSQAHKTLHSLSKNNNSLKGIFDLNYHNSKSDPVNLRDYRIGGYPLGTGTNSQAGFIGARELLAARSEADKANRESIIIYLTDGVSERYYSRTPASGGSYAEKTSEDYSHALNEAEAIKQYGTTIYTVALLASSENTPPPNGQSLLSQAASSESKYIVAKETNLIEKFREIGQDIKETTWTIDHSSVTLIDPMSEYVVYQSEGYNGAVTQMEFSKDYGVTWEPLPSEDWHLSVDGTDQKILTADILNYSSDYQYRFSYFVKVKSAAYGQMLHKDQTSGKSPEAGSAGVIANDYTYLSSDLVPLQEIMVPTVYVPLQEEASITSRKWAVPTAPDIISPALGYWTIQVLFSGEDVSPQNPKIPVTNVTLVDTLSPYVMYAAELAGWVDLVGEKTLKGTTDWTPVQEVQPTYSREHNTITWPLGTLHDDDYDYRITYPVQVRDEYKGVMIHKDQTSGTNPEDGTDGVVANGRTWLTYYLEETYMEYDILVPTVYRAHLVDFSFTKIFTDKTGDKTLTGAKFQIQQCTNPYSHTHTDTSPCWGEPITQTSDTNGLVYFANIKVGEYLLKELESPFGFELPSGYWIVSIQSEDDITFKGYATSGILPPAVKVDSEGKYAIPNFHVFGLPFSGQKGILLILLTGLAITISGLVAYKFTYIQRRKTYDKEIY
ncbi:hypothetical protein M2146_001577 [Lachnospiraceae bacterium PF1-22]|uniref:SpaA isopeptide-forming pilin-related protein n=1 Tax=Ohessyouella blattaphilus TaxID=2949333 RepID=UPI003E1D25FE